MKHIKDVIGRLRRNLHEVSDVMMGDYDWKVIAKAMGGKLLQKPAKNRSAKIFIGNESFDFHENGGEINISKAVGVGESVPYWSSAHPGGSVGPLTLAYRLKQEIEGKSIDYTMNLDK